MKTLESLETLALDALKNTVASCDREDDLFDLISEVADGCVPVYNSDLYGVFADSPDAINAALEDYVQETGGEDLGDRVQKYGLPGLITIGIYWHLEQYLQGQARKVWNEKEQEDEE